MVLCEAVRWRCAGCFGVIPLVRVVTIPLSDIELPFERGEVAAA